MKTPVRPLLGLLLLAGGLCAQPQPNAPMQSQESFSKTLQQKLSIRYLLYLPEDYAKKADQKFPLMLFLHGAGERGNNLDLVAKHGPPKIIKAGKHMPFIVVSPQCPVGQHWDSAVLLALLDDLAARLRVDQQRVYLTGLSMGGYGTWSLGIEHCERFAAIAPICGGGEFIKVYVAANAKGPALQSLGVWAFHGAKDTAVVLGESERMVEALKKFGHKDTQLLIYPNAGHDSWTATYDNPKLYEWFLQHQRK